MGNELLIFLIAQFCFLSGYLFGRLTSPRSVSISQQGGEKSQERNAKIVEKLKSVKIDEARFVTKVSDDKFEKNEKQLGSSSIVEDDISSSISKLAQLKQRK